MREKPNCGMIVLPDNMFDTEEDLIVALAIKHHIPDVQAATRSMEVGGLLRYSSDWLDLYRRAAYYVDQILKGANPGRTARSAAK